MLRIHPVRSMNCWAFLLFVLAMSGISHWGKVGCEQLGIALAFDHGYSDRSALRPVVHKQRSSPFYLECMVILTQGICFCLCTIIGLLRPPCSNVLVGLAFEYYVLGSSWTLILLQLPRGYSGGSTPYTKLGDCPDVVT